MTTEAFVRHYTAVADASPVPVLLYNFTALTGVNLLPAAVAQLAAHPNILGMKESGGDVAQIADLVNVAPRSGASAGAFTVLAGTTSTFYAALCVGAAGGILAPACVVPEACVRLFELTSAGHHDDARLLQSRLLPLARLLGAAYGVPGLKAALNELGYDVGRPRSPLTPVPDAAIAAIREVLNTLEAINV
jgi:4-hydroxy-2-oxoglutarate aldolase